jgi:alanine-synthesizing transaminase
VQRALPELLATRGMARDAILERLRQNLAVLARKCAGSAVTQLPVEGGWYAVVRVPATATDEAWALRLLDAGVLVQPGYFFDFGEVPHLVVSLLTEPAPFAQGVERLVAVAG